MKMVYPFIKLGGFRKPQLFKLHCNMSSAEALLKKHSLLGESVEATVASAILAIITDGEVQLDGDEGSSDNQNRWTMMKSDLALAAYCLDPQFHGDAPWTESGVMAALRRVAEKMTSINRATCKVDPALTAARMPAVMIDFSAYTVKLGQFSKGYAWDSVGAELACTWWVNFGGETPDLRFIAAQATGQFYAADFDETNLEDLQVRRDQDTPRCRQGQGLGVC